MGHRVRQIEEEGLVLAVANESNRLFGVALRQQALIRIAFDGFQSANQRKRRIVLVGLGPHVVAVGQAEIAIEAVVDRQMRGQMPQVPFADAGRGIAAVAQDFGDGALARIEARPRARREHAGDADADRIAARHQRGARRRTDGRGDIERRQSHAFGGHAVDVRRFDIRRAEAAQVLIALVVGEDQHEIRRTAGGFRGKSESGRTAEASKQNSAGKNQAGKAASHNRSPCHCSLRR
ncbi:MAG: hypothetical protein BWZ10_00236 [candidate division BRC1 bacterium ADurb.BinA364]|nr:MAG: hypothetical protein BWZ10_00236 [candidate division BRC1 bacterium ADurb.BinA364]